MVFTTRFAGGRGGRNGFETELARLHVIQKNSRPNHPTTCGKVERFQQTLKNWLRAQPHQPATITALQTLLDTFVDDTTTTDPTAHSPTTPPPPPPTPPAPKPPPATPTRPTPTTASATTASTKPASITLRHNGRLHHIGIGRTHARTPVIMLIDDLDIRIINAATGELLRHLTLDPTTDYQPTGAPKGPTPKTKRPEPPS